MGRGGYRVGAGRRAGTGKYGEQTVNVRVPLSLVGAVTEMLATHVSQTTYKRQTNLPTLILPQQQEILVCDPIEAIDALAALRKQDVVARVVMLDPWYRSRSPVGRSNFVAEAVRLLSGAAEVGEHVFLWGFAEHIARVMDLWPASLEFRGWLTWYYKNAPTRSKGWRPAQQACLHLARPGAKMYPENFYSKKHQAMAAAERLEYKPSPRSVIEAGLISGFIKKTENTGYPAQKPVSVIEPLLRMTMRPGDLVIDPTCGSGTTGAAAKLLGARALLSDRSAKAIEVSRKRLTKAPSIAQRDSDLNTTAKKPTAS